MTVDVQRLFFALWPPDEIAAKIACLAKSMDGAGKAVPQDQLHVTLAFRGRCNTATRDALIETAKHLRVPSFELSLDRLGCFRRPGIIWLGMSSPPTALYTLASALAGENFDPQRYVPHVTLQRKAGPVGAHPVVPMRWPVREFALVESGTAGVPGSYRTIATWPLA